VGATWAVGQPIVDPSSELRLLEESHRSGRERSFHRSVSDALLGSRIIPAMEIRAATKADAGACAAIYAPYVTDTVVSFETDPPAAGEMAERIASANRSHAWIVAANEREGEVFGYAYAGPFASRPAYRWSCVVSIYIEPGRRRRGAGRRLYETLFARLAVRGFRSVAAGMTLPNEASEGFHRALGFEPVGIYRRIGWKQGSWHDVAWMQRRLEAGQDPPVEPR
jgi:phosphinothricin acetyltransferase